MKEANKVYVTEDYARFKFMENNRTISESRKRKVKKSIETIGYVAGAPIIVNENYEIIDGQCRYLVCKELGLPIYFIIQPGAGIEECVSMNISATPWKQIDYIRSYAADGNDNYKFLLEKIEKYPEIRPVVITSICSDALDVVESSAISGGRFKVVWEKIYDIDSVLEFLARVIPTVSKIDGSATRMCYALSFAYRYSSADNERLEKIIGSMVLAAKTDKIGVSTTKHALTMIEAAYNNRLRAENKIRLCVEYEDFMIARYSWYEKKWGMRN